MNLETQALLAQVLDISKKKNVDDAEVIYNAKNIFSLRAFQHKIDEYKVASNSVLGIRIIKDNKAGISYSEASDDASIATMIDNAILNSKHLESKDENISNSTKILEDCSDIFYEDHTSTEDKIEFALNLEKQVLQKSEHVKSAPYNNYSEVEQHDYIANSKGALCFRKEKYFSCYTSALVELDKKSAMYYESSIGHKFNELNLNWVVDESFKHANNLLQSAKIKSGKYSVVFSNDLLSQIFSCFQELFSAKSAMDNINPWKDSLSKIVASSKLTITDDPFYIDAFSPLAFDSEGAPKGKNILLKDGLLENFLHNSVTSKFFKIENNNCASRSARSLLNVSSSNIVIDKGNQSRETLLAGKYLYLISAQGLGSGSDLSSGMFACGVSGYLCEDGEILHSVRDITLSANFFDLLKQVNLIGDMIGSNSYKNFFAPTIRFENISIGM